MDYPMLQAPDAKMGRTANGGNLLGREIAPAPRILERAPSRSTRTVP